MGYDRVGAAQMAIAPANVVYVQAGATALINGANVKAAYAKAVALTPGQYTRVAVICPPGDCDFGSVAFDMTNDYIDVLGVGVARCDYYFGSGLSWYYEAYNSYVYNSTPGTWKIKEPLTRFICDTDTEAVNISCADFLFQGIAVKQETTGKAGIRLSSGSMDLGKARIIDVAVVMNSNADEAIANSGNTVYVYMENFHTAAAVFKTTASLYGTFRRCSLGDYSIIYNVSGGSNYAEFHDCVAGNYCFCCGSGYSPYDYGLYNNVVAGDYCWAYYANDEADHKNCYGATYCFGSSGTPNGSYIECHAGDYGWCGSSGGTSCLMRRCMLTGQYGVCNFAGRMFDCTLSVSSDYGVTVASGSGPYIHGCKIQASGTSVYSGGDYYYMSQCMSNVADSGYNNISTHGNIVDGMFYI